MQRKWARFTAATVLAVVVTGSGVVLTAGSAGASTPIVVGNCAATVQGAPGTPVELAPSAVLQPVTNLVQALDLLNVITPTFKSTFAALPPIPVGAVPTGTGVITGGQIANAVVGQLNALPVLGPVLGLLVGNVQATLSSICGLTVTGVNAAAGPVQDGTGAIASASQQAAQAAGLAPKQGGAPGSGGAPGQQSGGTTPVQQGAGGSGLPASNSPAQGGIPFGAPSLFGAAFGGSLYNYGLAESPLSRYSGIPFATPGLFAPAPGVRYGGDVPGYAPSYGVLGQQDSTGNVPSVQTAGHAEALGPASGGGVTGAIGVPMLLAVLALAGVTAALVRTWVLRRVRSA